jgi:hypothetical protein
MALVPITEAEWLSGTSFSKMKQYLARRDDIGERKLRLFACACCRRLWHLLTETKCRKAVEVAELYADGMATKNELRAARNDANPEWFRPGPAPLAERAAARCALANASRAAWESSDDCVTMGQHLHKTDFYAGCDAEKLEQARLLLEIFGNPFRPYAVPERWPKTVLQLAEAFSNAQDCAFALHDALLEAGHAELAEHFREKEHPKGCWALDVIQGKQ